MPQAAIMTRGEFLTRGAIWLALMGYLASSIAGMQAGGRAEREKTARWLWTLGCTAYVAHVLLAFQFFHHWSHTAAYADTARQTAAVTGWNWGGGIYVNYAFTMAWLADVVWWWRGLEAHGRRPQWINTAWQGGQRRRRVWPWTGPVVRRSAVRNAGGALVARAAAGLTGKNFRAPSAKKLKLPLAFNERL